MSDQYESVRSLPFPALATALGLDLQRFKIRNKGEYYGPCPVHKPQKQRHTKNFHIGEHLTLRIGASAYNVFNHPNFDQPDHDLNSGLVKDGGTFGQIVSAVGPPTSIFGAFVGSQNAPRALQFKAEIRF